MTEVNSEDKKTGKNCLLSFRNKKVNLFDGENSLIQSFASYGYYFDKIAYVAYSDSQEILRALKDARDNYENIVVYCPKEMESTLKRSFSSFYKKQFDDLGILKSEKTSVFFLFSNKENRLQIKDIKRNLDLKYGTKYERAFIKTVGAPQYKLNSAIRKAKEICPEVDFNITDKFGDCKIEIVYSNKIPKIELDEAIRSIVEALNDYVYALEDSTLEERLYHILKLRRMKICVAESFTGGGVCKRLVNVSGVSQVFSEGLNTYSNASKIKRLGVKEFTLKQYGAVSPQTAVEMAEGLLENGNCDISIATTGIAGPKSDNSQKPVGLCYIAVGLKDTISVYKYNLKGDRDNITNSAINLALFLAFKTLK